jgi:hypothetical protein
MQAISSWILERKVESIKRVKAYNNFDSAKSVGVLFSADDENSYIASIDFIKYLMAKDIKVKGIGLLKSKERIMHLPMTKGIRYASYSDITLFSKFKNQDILDFTEKNFDILVDISQKDHFAVRAIIGLSKAKLKVTRFLEDYLFDFQIKVGLDKPVDFVTKQIVLYLSNIQKAS